MKKFLKFMRSKTGTLILFAAAAVLLAFSSVGGARAALIYSATYSSRVEMFDIGVALVENGADVSWRDYDEDNRNGTWNEDTGVLLGHMLDDADGDGNAEKLKFGAAYPEELRVRNNGTINEYVRVTVYRYWTRQGEDGSWTKDPSLSPAMIDLHFVTGDNGWHIDEGSTTDERTVLYYDRLLYADGAGESLSTPFSDTITIDGKVADIIEQKTETSADGGKTIVTTYSYDGARFVLEAHVDAVQEHNAADAIWSAWGRRAEAGNGSMRLTD